MFLAFHDYNGNGEMDEENGELPLSDIIISIGEMTCNTGIDGMCLIEQVTEGEHTYAVSDPSRKFKWVLPSAWEGIEIGDSISITVDQDKLVALVPLAEGRYVLPFPKLASYKIYTWYDHDKNERQVMNWLGEADNSPTRHGDYYYSFKVKVEDGHCAIDYVFQEDVPVIASDAGIVKEITQVTTEDHIVIILNDLNVRLNYGHVNTLGELHVGDRVSRGEVIGYATAHSYPYDWESVFQSYNYMIHQGFEPMGMSSHCDALDPFLPNLWTTSEYDLARISLGEQ